MTGADLPHGHNAVLRPKQLEQAGVQVGMFPVTGGGSWIWSTGDLIGTKPRAVILTHASNVSGGMMPIENRPSLAPGGSLSVDGAQTVGMHPVDMAEMLSTPWLFGAQRAFGSLGHRRHGSHRRFGRAIDPLVAGGTGASPTRWDAGLSA